MDRVHFEKGDDIEYSEDVEEKEDKDFDGNMKDQDFEEKNSIQICCAWGNRLEDDGKRKVPFR